jgi:hypothetical protein
MIRSALVSVGVVALVMSQIGMQQGRAQEERLQPIPNHGSRTVTWNDLTGEAAYRVSGTATYWPEVCDVGGPGEPGFVSEEVDFDQQLPADTTTYQWRSPQNQSLTFVKGVQITIDALGQDGAVLATDGVATTAEAAACGETGLPLAGRSQLVQPNRHYLLATMSFLWIGGTLLVLGARALRKRV